MANQFVNIPVLASNGAGAPVDVSKMGATKTIVVGSVGGGTTVTIEYAEDPAGAGPWAPLPNGSFQGPGRVTFDFAAHWLRAVTSSYSSGTPNADCGASGDGATFVEVGAVSVDISALPALKTVVVAGAGILEVSQDGVSWSQAFAFQNAGGQTQRVYGQFARWTGGGTVWLGGAVSGDDNGSPAFAISTTTIYARTTGSDTSGNGALANPYRTFQRAIRDAPNVIPPGAQYLVDITDLGTEALPTDYTFPTIQSSQINQFVSPPPFLVRASLTIQATPKLALAPAAAIITVADLPVLSADPDTLLAILTIPAARATWAAGALKGKLFVRTIGPATTSCAISDSNDGGGAGPSQLFLCNSMGAVPALAVGEEFHIVEPSAELIGTASSGTGAIECSNCNSIAFHGIKFTSSTSGDGLPALVLANCLQPSLELCDVDGMLAAGVPIQVGFFSSVLRSLIDAEGAAFTPRRSLLLGVGVGGGNYLFLSGPQIFRQTVMDGCATIESAEFAGALAIYGWGFLSVLITGSGGAGIRATGGRWSLTDTKIDGCAGDGIVAARGSVYVLLDHVTGAQSFLGSVGVRADDGAQVQITDTTTTTLTGVAGNVKSGSLAIAAYAIALNSYDIPPNSLVAVSTGTRIFEKA